MLFPNRRHAAITILPTPTCARAPRNACAHLRSSMQNGHACCFRTLKHAVRQALRQLNGPVLHVATSLRDYSMYTIGWHVPLKSQCKPVYPRQTSLASRTGLLVRRPRKAMHAQHNTECITPLRFIHDRTSRTAGFAGAASCALDFARSLDAAVEAGA